jgi:hypothetical protein
MATPEQVKSDKVVFKFGSYEWLTHFGLPIGLMIIGVIGIFSIVKDITHDKQIDSVYLWFHLPILIISFLAYWLQLQKLNLKLLNTCKNIQACRETIRKSLLERGWTIEYDNKNVLIASAEGTFCDEQLIVKYKTDAIFWTAINHPGNHNALASQVCNMKKANRLVAGIRAACA